jgi:KDO2-lipid IV(A) lauroyltransferase
MVIYHPLSNPYFERLIVRMRTRLGNGLYPMSDTLRGMLHDRGRLTATAFIADQSPPRHSAIWLRFLHQDTAVFSGTEKIARKLGYPVIYVHITRERRGRYRMDLHELVGDPSSTAPGEITEIHTRRLERDIQAQPELWLWTHRRWKHKRAAIGDRGQDPVA